MKKIGMGITLLVVLFTGTACGGGTQNEKSSYEAEANQISADNSVERPAQDPTDTPDLKLTASNMTKQGNPTRVYLSDITEVNDDVVNAWIKLSTQYDPTLSMYNYDSLAAGTKAIAATFSVTGFDMEETTLYWCYQLKSGGSTISVWDTSSPADILNINGDGTYRMMFDAKAALDGTLDEIESLQIVFPCGSETTGIIVDVSQLQCITNADELQFFSTGKVK